MFEPSIDEQRGRLFDAIQHLPDEERKAIRDTIVECDFATGFGQTLHRLPDWAIEMVAQQMSVVRHKVALATRRA